MPAGLDPLPVAVLSTADWNEDLPPLFVQDGVGGYVPDDLAGCGARVVIQGRGAPAAKLEMTMANGLLILGEMETELGLAPFIGLRVPAAPHPCARHLRPAGVHPAPVRNPAALQRRASSFSRGSDMAAGVYQGPAGVRVVQAQRGPQGPAPWSPIRPWAPGTVYSSQAPASVVSINNGTYACAVDHTSTIFVEDLAAGDWTQVFVGDANDIDAGAAVKAMLSTALGVTISSVADALQALALQAGSAALQSSVDYSQPLAAADLLIPIPLLLELANG